MDEKSNITNFKSNRVVTFVAFAIIAIFVIVVGLSINYIGNHLMQEADARYQIITDNVAEEITTWFSTEAQIVMNQKAALEINGYFDPDKLTKYLTRIVDDYNEDGYIYDLYFVNMDNVMSSGYGYIPEPSIDFRKRTWFVNAIEADDLVFSAPYKDSNLERYVVTISTTCYKQDGSLAGVLALDIFVDTLFSIANDKVINGNSYVFLVDNNNGIATHPYEQYGYVNDEPLEISSVPDGKYEYIENSIKHNLVYESSLMAHYNIRDYDGVFRSIYVSKIECCAWYVVAAVESSVFIAPLTQTILIIFLALVVCLIAGILLTRFITGQMIKQLNQANEAAQAANEAKSIFLANMSHEIRTPINAIIGMNEMVIRENHDPVINDYALDISSASRSLVTIVNDILDISKIESGKLEFVETEFNIGSVINDIVNMSESRLGNKQLTLIFDVDPTIPIGLIGDENRIKQVIINMMTNAIKYTHEGYVKMTAKYTKQEYGINLNVSVADSGIGIAEKNLDQLYQSFQRFDTRKNRSIEGTGLGLSITKRLVQNMGGFINVSSKLGYGSEFSVSIPLKVMDEKPFVEIETEDRMKFVTLFDLSFADERLKKEMLSIDAGIQDGLGIQMLHTNTFDQMCEMLKKDNSLTHVMIDKAVFATNESYFCELAKNLTVVVVQKRAEVEKLPAGILDFCLPFYSISLAAFINHKKTFTVGNLDLFEFEAPQARIMIVDDNAMNLKVAAGLLKPYKMQVTTVDSGMKAIDILNENPTYDIVFMDHMMPEMDGIEALLKIREIPGDYYRNLTIIALTANTVNSARTMFLDAGFADFLAKPINTVFLDKLLKKYIPSDKIIVKKEKAEKSDENKTIISSEKISAEKTNNVDMSDGLDFNPQLGLKYMSGNQDLYLEILKDYVKESDDMKQLLLEFYNKKDWNNYVIKVHALKSTSLNIGAAPLSEQAKELELSGKAGNYEPIIQKTQEMLSMYEKVLRMAEQYLQEHGIVTVCDSEKLSPSVLKAQLDQEIVLEYTQKFENALDAYDGDAAETIFEECKARGDLYTNLFDNVLQHIRNYEYDNAKEELERIKNS